MTPKSDIEKLKPIIWTLKTFKCKLCKDKVETANPLRHLASFHWLELQSSIGNYDAIVKENFEEVKPCPVK